MGAYAYHRDSYILNKVAELVLFTKYQWFGHRNDKIVQGREPNFKSLATCLHSNIYDCNCTWKTDCKVTDTEKYVNYIVCLYGKITLMHYPETPRF